MATETLENPRGPDRFAEVDAAGHGLDKPSYVGAFDGMRGIALLAMLNYHSWIETGYDPSWLKGGWLSLSTFFALSGFLITRLIIFERETTSNFRLGDFWLRRAKRLLPALTLGLLLVMTVSMLRVVPYEPQMRNQLVAIILYGKNIHTVWLHGPPGIITEHLWSLAVEEQFYVVFPLLFLVCRRFGRWWPMVTVATALMLTSIYLAMHYNHSGQAHAAYLSTPARACEILIGVVTAYVVVTPPVRRLLHSTGGARLLKVVAVPTLAAMAVLWRVADVTRQNEYAYAFANAFLASILITTALVGGPVTKLLSLRPLRWLGRVSYGAYVYHLPLFYALSRKNLHLHDPWSIHVIRIGATLVLAGLSLRYLETPVRQWRTGSRRKPVMVFLGSTAILLLLAVSLPFPKPKLEFTYRTKPPASAWYALNDDPAHNSTSSVVVVGDATLTAPAIPGLKELVSAEPGGHWVNDLSVADCSVLDAGPRALGGRAVDPPRECRISQPGTISRLLRDQPSHIVVATGLLDLADHLVLDGSFADISGIKFRNVVEGQVRSFVYQLTLVPGIERVDLYLLDPETVPAQFHALEQRSARWRRTEFRHKGTVPSDLSDDVLRGRARALNDMFRRAASHYPVVHVHPAMGPTTLDRDAWKALLG